MALNFFYNTGIDANNVIIFDEPWSRPGDYVLLRALTDLVCVSSACPDDIDAANAWNPTDIHVRTYSDKERFSRAIAHRMTPDAEPKLTRETAFHSRFAAHTRDFTEYRGYWLPQKFNNGGADRRILGVPRARRRDGPVAAPEIRGHRAGRRSADAIRADPRRAKARRRPGRLFGHVLRARRHARRRNAVPPRPQQFPLDRRRRIRRRLAARARREDGLLGLGPLLDRPAPQHRGAGSEEPRHPEGRHLDAAGAAEARGAAMVPLSRSVASAAYDGAAGRRLAHRLYGRARLRDLLPSEGRGKPFSTRSGRPASRTASRRSACRRSTCCGSRPG